MSQPLDRTQACQKLGAVDTAAGEFWVDSPFQMPSLGHNLSAYENNRLFVNHQGQRFLDASYTSMTDIDSDSRSVVAADFDQDGDIDLLVASVGGGPLRLFRNQLQTNHHRVRVKLKGTASNRSGIGARVVAICGSQTITRDLFPANGFMGQGPTELIVGVGSATVIDKFIVRWPTGKTQTFENVPVDCTVEIQEGSDRISL